MNQNKKPLQLPRGKPTNPHLQQPRIINRGPAVASPNTKRPVAPPVYRPQSGSKSVQAKIPENATSRTRPAAFHQPRVIQRMALTVGSVDAIIRGSMRTILVRKEGQPEPSPHAQLPSLETGNLATIGQNETLYLDGHGAAPEAAGIPGAAQKFGGYTPEQLAAKLVEKGLPQNYGGKIYLNGCNTANSTTGEAYASRFQKALALRNRLVIVKGNTGYSQVQDSGKTRVNPPTEIGSDERGRFKQMEQRADALYKEFIDPLTTPLRRDAIKAELPQVRDEMMDQHRKTYLTSKLWRPTLPVLQNLSYEITPGAYAVIPGDNNNGKSLRTHITRALNKYAKQWNLFASAESTAALPVLRGLLIHPQKLFVAVRWYITAAQPRPPAEFVQVGNKLRVGSDLYTYLQEEFNTWQA